MNFNWHNYVVHGWIQTCPCLSNKRLHLAASTKSFGCNDWLTCSAQHRPTNADHKASQRKLILARSCWHNYQQLLGKYICMWAFKSSCFSVWTITIAKKFTMFQALLWNVFKVIILRFLFKSGSYGPTPRPKYNPFFACGFYPIPSHRLHYRRIFGFEKSRFNAFKGHHDHDLSWNIYLLSTVTWIGGAFVLHHLSAVKNNWTVSRVRHHQKWQNILRLFFNWFHRRVFTTMASDSVSSREIIYTMVTLEIFGNCSRSIDHKNLVNRRTDNLQVFSW